MIAVSLPIGTDQPWWFLGFALLIGHSIADYPLQGEFLALGKNHRLSPENKPDGVEGVRGLWLHCLTAHAFIHAGMVWAISGIFLLGLCELVLHWLIDFVKSEGWTNFHVDQFLHVLCKAGYVAVLYFGIVPL